MYKVIIIDDEPLARNLIKEYLSDLKDLSIIDECDNGFEGLRAIQKHEPDIVFLDIQMPKISGFEMLELVEKRMPHIIFTTAFDEFALQAFDANAVDYLLKPFRKDRFDRAVQKVLRVLADNSSSEIDTASLQFGVENRVVVKVGADIKIIPCIELVYIEAYDDYVKLNTKDRCYVKKQTMSYYEKHLDSKGFIRIHRSYILNILFVDKLEYGGTDGYKAVLKNGKILPVSRSGYSLLKKMLGV